LSKRADDEASARDSQSEFSAGSTRYEECYASFKFHYAKSDFKYNDQFLTNQRLTILLKSIKINAL